MENKSVIYVNGEIVPAENAAISVVDQGVQFGWGLFETMRVYNGKAFMLDEHLTRMLSSVKRFQIPFSEDKKVLAKGVEGFIEAAKIKDMVLKIILTKGGGTPGIIFTYRPNPYTQQDYTRGFSAKVSSIRRNDTSPLVYMKTLNFMDNLLAKNEASGAGYNEALFLNTQGMVCEGSSGNIFFIKNQKLYTPEVSCGLLPGIARQLIIEKMAPSMGIEVVEGKYLQEQLLAADEVFLTNSVIEVMPICKIGQTAIGDGMPGSLTATIMKGYRDCVEKIML